MVHSLKEEGRWIIIHSHKKQREERIEARQGKMGKEQGISVIMTMDSSNKYMVHCTT